MDFLLTIVFAITEPNPMDSIGFGSLIANTIVSKKSKVAAKKT